MRKYQNVSEKPPAVDMNTNHPESNHRSSRITSKQARREAITLAPNTVGKSELLECIQCLLKILDIDIDREKSEIGSCEPCTETLTSEVIRLAMLDTSRSTAIDFAEHFDSDVE
jgi:hypothetical protein